MTKRGFAKALAVFALPAVLAACGNDTTTINPLDLAQEVFSGLVNRDSSGASQIPATQIETAYDATTSPIALVTIEERRAQALVQQIERNGAYQTFATSARQVFILRNGVMTGTRGLGGDLMSSDIDGLLALVSNKRSGTSRYVMRFLTGEDVTETLNVTCDVFPDGTQTATQGRIRAAVTKMIANCTGDALPFTDTFLVDGSGYVLSSRQWMGNFNGYMTVQTLRK